tara:strand:+ start:417 stop:1130 length:714 start_codon:yes stop_codon:yes gene_type:complete
MQKNIKSTFDKIAALLKDDWQDDLDMGEVLSEIEHILPDLLSEDQEWDSMLIDYEPPYLMRVYRKLEISKDKTVYINLHYFFSPHFDEGTSIDNPYRKNKATATEDLDSLALYHPHPWAAGFKIISGEYTQRIGHAKELGLKNKPTPGPEQIQDAGSKYAFNDPHTWHIVLPKGTSPIMTLMATYIPETWNQVGPKPKNKQRKLTPVEKDFVLKEFQDAYPQQKKQPPRISRPRLRK